MNQKMHKWAKKNISRFFIFAFATTGHNFEKFNPLKMSVD